MLDPRVDRDNRLWRGDQCLFDFNIICRSTYSLWKEPAADRRTALRDHSLKW